MQTRFGSFVESWANIVIGFSLNFGVNLATLPWLWDPSSPKLSAFKIGLVFTAISLVRSFLIRRYFNGMKWGNGASHAQNGHDHAQVGLYAIDAGPRITPRSVFPVDAAARNEFPMYDGLLAYFPSALAGVSRVSKIGNDQHNPGQPMHHARGKSMDHANKLIRHVMDGDGEDVDGTLHADKASWRALARSQEIHEARGAPLAPGARLP
jgi:hypothetical protein